MSTIAIGRPTKFPKFEMLATLWSRVASSRLLAYAVFLALYLPAMTFLAQHKLLWDDEFFTLYLSNAGSWSELVRAMATGADQHPPSFYWATHLLATVFGASNITLRLLSIGGFALMCVSVYEIVGRIVNREWGFCAMLLPLACRFSWYSVEARGYASQIGFVGLAFLCWMLATAGRRRWLTLPLLAAALCGAVGSHYYALTVLLPLAVGEGARTIVNRRIDWAVWVSFGGALIPIAAFARLIGSAQGYSTHFWAIPHWGQMFQWYPDALGYAGAVPVILLAVVTLRRGGARWPKSGAPMEVWHLAGFAALALLPVVLVGIAKTVTHAFHPRYSIAALPGVCVLLTVGMARLTGYSRRYAAALWLLLLGCHLLISNRYDLALRGDLEDLRGTDQFLRRHSAAGPIAVSHVTRFHRLSFYARRDLAGRIAYLADPQSAIEYLGWDTVDRGLLALNPWFPLNTRWIDEWVAEHPSFLLLGPAAVWSWAPQGLAKLGADARLIDVFATENLLLSVRDLKVSPTPREPNDPTGRPMLFDRMPATGRPICELYLSPGSCPNID
jgi:hypothetical protein